MSICSAHQEPVPDCPRCQATPRDLFPDWDQMHEEARIAGLMTCSKCGFEFYRTSEICPACNAKAVEMSLAEALVKAEIFLDNTEQDEETTRKVVSTLYFYTKLLMGRLGRMRAVIRENSDDPKSSA